MSPLISKLTVLATKALPKVVTVVLAVPLMLLAWHSIDMPSQHTENLRLMQGRRYPYLLAGSAIPLPAWSVDLGKPQGRLSGPILLLAVSDTCPGCKAVVPIWETFIRSLDGNKGQVWIVAFDGRAFADRLAAAVPAAMGRRLLKPATTNAFTVATGLSSVPGMFVLDEQLNVVLTTTGSSAEQLLALVRQHMEGPPVREDPFLRPRIRPRESRDHSS